ncbi:hypothetical protein [Flammeovirga agarivorans]|uniref:Uncharacterized protein n=1 Tax=Flammeovirga agarivorans TaxID=2726742 RepID=A0A7X8SQW7_9BACT|nr:hypothetical protein [Flammeovirga agarivorans]NLR94644.1 hypothetical protein [Flammeovirga agarivorans]
MLEFNTATKEKLINSKIKNEEKLYLISRYIEEKYCFQIQPNHWDDKFDNLLEVERIYYRTWLWLCYAEWENLVVPVPEFEVIYGSVQMSNLTKYIKSNKDNQEIDKIYSLDGKAGIVLLEWGLENLQTIYNIS